MGSCSLCPPMSGWLVWGLIPGRITDWMVKHGADLLVQSSEVSTNLSFHLDNGRLAILGTNLTFETIAASDVNQLARAGVFQSLVIPKPEKGPGVALVFKTREGGLGVMQLLGFSAKPEPVLRLRYKLVRHSSVASGQPADRR